MLVEIDEVAVSGSLWELVKSGDVEAKAKLREILHGIVLYMHALSTDSDEVSVSLKDLERAGVVDAVCIMYHMDTPILS